MDIRNDKRAALAERLMPRILRALDAALEAVDGLHRTGKGVTRRIARLTPEQGLAALDQHDLRTLIDKINERCWCPTEHRGDCGPELVIGEPVPHAALADDEYEIPYHYDGQDLIIVCRTEGPDYFEILRVYPDGPMYASFDGDDLLAALHLEVGGKAWDALEVMAREAAASKLACQREDADEARAEQARDDRRMGLDR